jgi:hypothetical protein
MKLNKNAARFVTAAVVIAAMAAVAGCREEEQGRPLVYEKGTYLGKPDQQITEAQEQELRQRARKQAF